MSRRIRRRAAREGPPLVVREVAPGVFDLTLPIPPGMSAEDAAAAVEAFRARVRAELGIELGPVHACDPATCPHHRR